MQTREYFTAAKRHLLSRLRHRTVQLKCHDVETSLLEGVCCRGDRRLARAIEAATEEFWGRRIYLNGPGAVGAICMDMGFDLDLIKGVYLLSRIVGLVAHTYEEMHRERGWRASTNAPIVQPLDLELQKPEFYDGPPERTLPPERTPVPAPGAGGGGGAGR